MMLAAWILSAAVFSRPMERVASLDPTLATSAYDARVASLLYETPLAVDYRARPYRLVPGVCELPEVSADGLTYLFRFRRDERGERLSEVGAADMVRSLERLRDPEKVCPNGWLVKAVDTIRALDDATVEIRLKRRQHSFPWLMAQGGASIVKPDGDGTGPFELVRWRKNHEMLFRRRAPATTGDADFFEFVRYLIIDDASTQWLMFLKGEIDFLGEISRDNWDAVIGDDGQLDPQLQAAGVELHSMPSLDIYYIGMNMRDPVLGKNRALRQALTCAFDYARWEKFYNGRIAPANGPVPPGVGEGRVTSPAPFAFDVERARRLMTEAGYPDGIDPATGRRLVLSLAIGRASQDSRESGELLAAFFEKIGVRLELKFYTWNAFLKAVDEGRVQLYRMAWVGDYPDAENFLQLFHSSNVSPGPNHSFYMNAEYDREFDAAEAAENAEDRAAHFIRCQEILREDCPWIFCNHSMANSLVHRRVGDYVPSDFPYGQEQFFTVRDGEEKTK